MLRAYSLVLEGLWCLTVRDQTRVDHVQGNFHTHCTISQAPPDLSRSNKKTGTISRQPYFSCPSTPKQRKRKGLGRNAKMRLSVPGQEVIPGHFFSFISLEQTLLLHCFRRLNHKRVFFFLGWWGLVKGMGLLAGVLSLSFHFGL